MASTDGDSTLNSSLARLYSDLHTLCSQWFYGKSDMDTALNGKQATLVSGTNIKTINNQSILGSGNISVQGGGTGSRIFDLDQTSNSGNIAFTEDDDCNGSGFSLGDGMLIYNSANSTFYLDKDGNKDFDNGNELATIDDLPSVPTNANIVDLIYPVGSIYISVNSTNPSTIFGGSWTQIEDTFLLACGSTYASDGSNVHTAQHGEATHTLTSAESGQKNLGTVTSTGGNHTHKLSSTDNKARFLGTTSDGDGVTRSSIKPGTSTAVSNFLKSVNTVYRYDGDGSSGNLSVSTTISGSDATSSHNNMPPYMAVYMWKRTA